MNEYLIMPYNGRWFKVEAKTSEMAYRSQCYWFNERTMIAVMNLKTGKTDVYHSERKENGNYEVVKGVI